MTNKKLAAKRLIIFLLLSFGMTYALFFIYIINIGWTMDSSWYGVMTASGMLMPAAANILTRIITKEGFENSFLRMKISGNIRYFAIGLILPVFSGVIISVVVCMTILPKGSLGNMFSNIDAAYFFSIITYLFGITVAGTLFGFGEEFGWRGYMTPKLEILFDSEKKRLSQIIVFIIGGTIWGLWHAPIIACGHNFGKDYPGYPWLGIGLMCISCICFGIYLTALTKASGSVLPAALAHMSINNITNSLSSTLLGNIELSDEIAESLNSGFSYKLIDMIVMSAVFLAAGVLIMITNTKKKKKKKTL